MKTIKLNPAEWLILLLILLALLSGCSSREQRAQRCIELSEGTDGDICDCLYKYSLTDSIYCQ